MSIDANTYNHISTHIHSYINTHRHMQTHTHLHTYVSIHDLLTHFQFLPTLNKHTHTSHTFGQALF